KLAEPQLLRAFLTLTLLQALIRANAGHLRDKRVRETKEWTRKSPKPPLQMRIRLDCPQHLSVRPQSERDRWWPIMLRLSPVVLPIRRRVAGRVLGPYLARQRQIKPIIKYIRSGDYPRMARPETASALGTKPRKVE